MMLYHGCGTPARSLYRLGLALFALDKPEVCLLRGDEWNLRAPDRVRKNRGRGQRRLPCGFTIGADGDTINLYYGAADTSMALATGSIKALLEWLDQHGRPPPAVLTSLRAGVPLSPARCSPPRARAPRR